MVNPEHIEKILANVSDPEVPVLSVLDLGIIREIKVDKDKIYISITPTYSGCPAMQMITHNIKFELLAHNIQNVEIIQVLSPAWTTDWMSEAGKEKLKAFGIAPPQYKSFENKNSQDAKIPCPLCDSMHTKLISEFGSTSCKSLYQCLDCLEPFDYFKCH